MPSPIHAARLFLSWMLRSSAAVLPIFAACSVTAAAAPVRLYFDRDVGPVEFAAQEITLAFEEAGLPIDQHDVGKLEGTHGIRIILTDLSDAPTLEMFESSNDANLETLQPEGFRIRVTTEGMHTTYWIIGADPAGTRPGPCTVDSNSPKSFGWPDWKR